MAPTSNDMKKNDAQKIAGLLFLVLLVSFPYRADALSDGYTAGVAGEITKVTGETVVKACSDASAVCKFSCDSKTESSTGSCSVPDSKGSIQTECCKSNTEQGKAAAATVVAQAGSSMDLYDPLGNIGLLGIMGRIVQTFLGLSGSIAFLGFVYAGVVYMTSAGDDKKVSQAKATMVNAVLGLIIIMLAFQLSDFFLKFIVK